MSEDTNDRKLLYTALELIEDSLAGGYRLGRRLPAFAEFDPDALSEASDRPAAAFADSSFVAPVDLPDNDSLAAIAAEAARCRKCRLASGRSRAVSGEGAERPLVLVIGEGPGAEEDRTGRPFVGPAGQLLDKMLAAIGLSRSANTYIANIVKCRPPMNRDPAPDEQAACMAYLDRQIALLRPRAILAAGRIPAQALLSTKEGIGKLRGKLWDYRGVPLVASYHPSALLRNEELKRPAWEDLKLLKTALPDA
ncbi:MAG TPA: uracil-DNA glycosylase [Spirochaetaceae bacterium]|jgi:DNA polymerase|nr:uracil-DNA glycosylase [Spirochaetaceae bacterium]